jgi:nicotinate-nucleotide adenylyltransferase
MGVFGGTFDPIHFGHLAAAEEVWAALALDTVVFVPNLRQPLKQPGLTPAVHRLAMVDLAIAGNAHFASSDVELHRTGPSYTLETLRALRAAWGEEAEIFFLLGADAIAQFASWHRPDEIVALARLVVMSRSGMHEPHWPSLERSVPRMRERIHVVRVPDLDISATDLRKRLADGRPVRYQMPEAVLAYIARHGLYGTGRDA